ncbi:periplasmic nitrate reductase, NapE protein [Aliamphritea ceti]|uniref:periplasmic nitrate reductase, NapE protein n=1 Tax=Aliamphritea ceti TaxID=1524258 RepID=UPI0021C3C1B7|nr:periplasmic nitrate reductase, NapE protein [Aliamphritea ceti]
MKEAANALPQEESGGQNSSRFQETRAFLFLTGIIAPAVAVSIVVGYGFIVWISQILTGPPGS